jgi:hypothetical protein
MLAAPDSRANRWAAALMIAAAAAWLLIMVVGIRDHTPIAGDDAFISLQYARNLARGEGLVFNRGERVWGFTSPLQTLLLGGIASAGADPLHAAFTTGMLWAAVAACLLFRLSAEVLPTPLALCAGLACLLDPSLHGKYPMESSLLAAVQLGFLLAAIRQRALLANLLGALACLARPDSLLLVLPILLLGRETRRLRNLALFAAIGLLWEGFAFVYYGDLLPNSLHAKRGLAHSGWYFAEAIVSATNSAWAVDLPAAAVVAMRVGLVLLSAATLLNPRVRQRPALAYALFLYPWLLLGAYAWIGSPPEHRWEYHSARFLLHAGAAIGLLSVLDAAAARWRVRPPWRTLAVGVILLFVVHDGVTRSAANLVSLRGPDTATWSGARYAAYRRVTEWIENNLPPRPTVALHEVGTVAYFSDVTVVDVSGIVTRGYAPHERGQLVSFLHRFASPYALSRGDVPEMRIGDGLRYRRLAYFPGQGYADLSLLAREADASGREG